MLEHVAGFRRRQIQAFGQLHQPIDVRQVDAVDEVSTEEGVVNSLAVRLGDRPGSQLLGEAAVVRHGPPIAGPRKALLPKEGVEPLHHVLQQGFAAGKEVRQRPPLCRRVGMQREMHVDQLEVVLAGQSIGTDRTEIAPRSNVVGEDFESPGHREILKNRCGWRAACPPALCSSDILSLLQNHHHRGDRNDPGQIARCLVRCLRPTSAVHVRSWIDPTGTKRLAAAASFEWVVTSASA